MTLEIKRLHLAQPQGVDGGRRPVCGFVATHLGVRYSSTFASAGCSGCGIGIVP